MRFMLQLMCLLSLFETIFSLPIEGVSERQPSSTSISWKRFLPTIGTLGLLASLIGIVVLGTRADEAYKAMKMVEKSTVDAKYFSLPFSEQNYVVRRMEFIGKDMSEDEREQMEGEDLLHGWPPFEMPDTSQMGKATKNALKTAYKSLKSAIHEVDKAEEKVQDTMRQVEAAVRDKKQAQYLAAVVAATEWKDALAKAKGQKGILARNLFIIK